ncbi:hypothetical protein GpartN1_g1028.t1 [Galdieria partita]|uniref:Lipid-A-disaccharide synthase n=1 Tax=Galdieria partita TaxID=83374 RepID=A0A9C7PT70_9RHOD|nr:hypothetical protein GpartN1_g1028.t1 [Galdieria partita]
MIGTQDYMAFVISHPCSPCRNCKRRKLVQRIRHERIIGPILVLMSTELETNLLILSNGHGEDKVSSSVAKRMIEILRNFSIKASVNVLPLVGNGSAYFSIARDVHLAGPVKEFPSGGFVNHRPLVFLRDIREGLLGLIFSQFQSISKWRSDCVGRRLILAVGDVWPLFLATQAKTPFIFIGTAKSEYYVRDENGALQRRNFFEQVESLLSSVYYPWERTLMKQALAVYPRDALTALHLAKCGLTNVKYFGNPMMDDLEPTGKLLSKIHASLFLSNVLQYCGSNRIVLLPGSRQDEMYRNIEKLLASIKDFAQENRVLFLLSCPPSASPALIDTIICRWGWSCRSDTTDTMEYQLDASGLLVSFNEFSDCIHFSSVGIAMAGTATEQLVGIGRPVITIPGEGPQFTYSFAEAQKRLLGESVFFLEDASQVKVLLQELCTMSRTMRNKFVENGIRKLGKAGASKKIALDIVDIIRNMKE